MLNKIFFLSLCSTLLSPVYGMDPPDEKQTPASKPFSTKNISKTARSGLGHEDLKKIFTNMEGAEIQKGHFYAFKGSVEKYNEIAGILEKEKDVNAVFQGENFCGSANTLGEGFSRDLVKYALYLTDGMARTPMLYQVRLTNSKNPAVKEDVELLLYLRKEGDRDDQLLCKVKNKPDSLLISKSGDPHTSTVHGCAADTYDAIVNELKSMIDSKSSPQSLDPANTLKVLQYTRLHNYTDSAPLFFEVSFLTKKPESRETAVVFAIRKLKEEHQSPKIMRTFTYSYPVFTDEEYFFDRFIDSIEKNNDKNNVEGISNFLCRLALEDFPNGMSSEGAIKLADLQEKLGLPRRFNNYLSERSPSSTHDEKHSSKNRLNLSSMTIDNVKDLENFAQRLLEEDIKQFKKLRIDTIIRTSKNKETDIVTSGEKFIEWVQAIIMSAQEKERREQVLQNFIDIAVTLFKKNNFHRAFQLVQAFQGHEVSQALKSHGADKLSSNIEWRNLHNALAMNNNFKNYRALKNNVQQESRPYLPIFPVIVKDFTYIHEQYLLAPPGDRIIALEGIAEILRECFYLKSYRESLPSSTIKKTLELNVSRRKTSEGHKKKTRRHTNDKDLKIDAQVLDGLEKLAPFAQFPS